jgi:hypothetical protein
VKKGDRRSTRISATYFVMDADGYRLDFNNSNVLPLGGFATLFSDHGENVTSIFHPLVTKGNLYWSILEEIRAPMSLD